MSLHEAALIAGPVLDTAAIGLLAWLTALARRPSLPGSPFALGVLGPAAGVAAAGAWVLVNPYAGIGALTAFLAAAAVWAGWLERRLERDGEER